MILIIQPRRQTAHRISQKQSDASREQKQPAHQFYLYLCKTLCLSVIRKFFPLDKNYLLEEAQLALQDTLLTQLIEKIKLHYQLIHNPLGLDDSFSRRIRDFETRNFKPLYIFYQNLAAVYRYKSGDNQLEFVWDGRDHQEKYQLEWTAAFEQWTNDFCRHELFLQAVLDLTVFLPDNRHAHLAESRMNHFIIKHFEVKFHKSRGLVQMKVA
jgi:hypothetical protein